MNKFVFLTLVLLHFQIIGQDLPMSLEYKEAIQKGTRTLDGSVSKSYWQNSSSYELEVKIDPANKLLSGSGSIVYQNNSPDTLTQIALHAYHNYYKEGSRRAGFFAETTGPITDGMVMDALTIEGEEVDITNKEIFQNIGTQYVIELSNPLLPNNSLAIECSWHYTIPGEGFERSGAIDETSMFIAYWYPEVAVYDDIHTWDVVTYDASSEFYHDVSDYTVSIEVPKNYCVWGPSPLLNPGELLSQKQLQKYEEAKTSKEKVTLISEKDAKNGFEMEGTVWRYEAKGFPDFAFALSDHFVWEAASYEDPNGNYFLHSAYDPENEDFGSVIEAQQLSLQVFHNDFPKKPFPFKHFTIFNGLQGGGMEFPGMANDQAFSPKQIKEWTGEKVTSLQANIGVTLHEMFHMYFPFQMGINEKRYAWMDEGWADFADYFNPHKYEFFNGNRYIAMHWAVPMMVPTYTRPNHSWINSYTIGSYSYYSLYHLLGEEKFDQCMSEYIDRWSGKHPTPYDFFFTFNDVTSTDLDWFWKNWYFGFGYPDLAIEEVSGNGIIVKNEGGRALAFELSYEFSDGTQVSEIISPVVWKDGSSYTHSVAGELKKASLKILGGSDTVANNNSWQAE